MDDVALQNDSDFAGSDYLSNEGLDDVGYFPYRITNTEQTRPPKKTACRCCGENGLSWGVHNKKWRLFKHGELHNCPVNPLTQPEPATPTGEE